MKTMGCDNKTVITKNKNDVAITVEATKTTWRERVSARRVVYGY